MLAPLRALEHWHEFYILVGTAAAALVALLFVAVSVGAGVVTEERAAGTRTFISPVIVHFSAVLYACVLGLVPSHTRLSFAALLGGAGALAAVYASNILAKVLRDPVADRADRCFYGAAPVVAYVGAVVAAVLMLAGLNGGAEVLACALILLLLANIRNAWDLATFIVRQQSRPH
jgi:hypothetical protein